MTDGPGTVEPDAAPDAADDEVEVAGEEVAVELDDGGAELEPDETAEDSAEDSAADSAAAVGTKPLSLPATQLRLPPEPTGDARVDGALERLGDLEDLPTSEHVAVFEDVQRRLQSALADLGPGA